MPNIAYAEKLEEFRAQLRSKEEERDAEIARYDKEIAALEQIIKTLTGLLKQPNGKSPVSARGLDNLILHIFKQNPTARLSRKEILKKLLDSGADLSGFTNRMSYVHASVRRLHQKRILSREWTNIPDSKLKKAFYFLPESES